MCGRFTRKNRAKPPQSAHFYTFFQKTTVFIEKQKTLVDFLLYKYVYYKFCVFTIKSDLGNVSESSGFRFETILNIISYKSVLQIPFYNRVKLMARSGIELRIFDLQGQSINIKLCRSTTAQILFTLRTC